MAIADQTVTDHYAIYNADCLDVLPSLPAESIHLSIYSPPFATSQGGLYRYSSSDRDLSNARTYEEFLEHYGMVVSEVARVTLPGRVSLVHCMDIPTGNSGDDELNDFPGDLIRLHRSLGFRYKGRYHIWKEPLTVRNRTLTKSLAHKTIVEDSTLCSVANADYLLIFKKKGENPIPVRHPQGLTEYHGEREIPRELLPYRGWRGKQTENRYSHWIWRQYASSFWDDIRLDNVLPFKAARDEEDEKHVHPLQLDVIARGLVLYSNPGETLLTPFGGVGSEPYGAVRAGRRGVAMELKPSYYRQMAKALEGVQFGGEAGSDQPALDFGTTELEEASA